MKKILLTAIVSGVLAVQSTASVANTLPTTQGLCTAMPSWTHSWLPCYNK